MTPYEKYTYWLMLSDYDIETAKVLIDGKRWAYVTYTCQQSIERLVKGMHVYFTEKESPKSHNAAFLLIRLARSEKFNRLVDMDKFREEQRKQEDFFADLMFYYMSDYPFSYKKVMDRFVSEEVAMDVYKRTLDILKWLKGLIPKESINEEAPAVAKK